ncbi:MAG: hypothetical protein V1889_00085 [archaeon]
MKIASVFILSIIFFLSMVCAASTASANNQQQTQLQNEITSNTQERIQEMRKLNEEKIENLRERIQEREEILLEKKNITLKRIDDKIIEMKEKGNIIRTRLNLSSEGNGSQIRIRLSNGRNAEIKIMPETASARAIERLRLKNCDGNCTIELKEVGQGNKTRAVYEARVQKTFRLFGFIKRNKEVLTQIDAETGEEVTTRRPWWSFLATEKEK